MIITYLLCPLGYGFPAGCGANKIKQIFEWKWKMGKKDFKTIKMK